MKGGCFAIFGQVGGEDVRYGKRNASVGPGHEETVDDTRV